MAATTQNSTYFDAIASIIRVTSYLSGESYFSSILSQFHQFANTDFTFIGRLKEESREIETTMLLAGDQILENVSYSLKGTPCDQALDTGTCAYADHICDLFPDDQLLIDMTIEGYIGTTLTNATGQPIGIIVALYKNPIENLELVKSLFNFFAGQIATVLINEELQANLEQLVESKTEQIQAQSQQLKIALETSEKLFEFSPDSLFQVNQHGRIIKSNSQAEKLFGHSKAEMLVMNIDALVPSKFKSGHKKQREYYHSNPTTRHMEATKSLQAQTKTGDLIPVEITLATTQDVNGEISIIASVRDVTVRRALEESLLNERNRAETLAQQNTRFLANMSHEIRTPMNGVIGMAQLLEATTLSEQQCEYLSIIQNSGKTLLTVINDILDFVKVSEGKIQFEETNFDYHKWMGELVQPYQLELNSEVTILSEIDEKIPPYLIGDTSRLHQLLANLLSNAVKFTKQGFISLRSKLLNESDIDVTLQFEISDTGIGISKEALTRIFEDFEQAEISTNRTYGGTGLGLSICKELVQLAGGKIWTTSTLGKGSTFYVTLSFPIGNKPNDVASEKESSKDLSLLKVLVAEDTPISQLVTIGMLKRLGITAVDLVENGTEALKLASTKSRDFDLILMDCEMPIMNGYEASQNIREWEKSAQQKPSHICALTAHATPEYQKKASMAGMNFYLSKPLQLDQLKRICESI